MSHTIAVVADEKKGRWKVLVNYVQRGMAVDKVEKANADAIAISEREACDHLILAKVEA